MAILPEIKCPRCGSQSYRKNGHINNKQRYLCKKCKRQFVSQINNNISQNILTNINSISALLLDIENLKINRQIEEFLGSLTEDKLQLKIAFANWKSPNLTCDNELYERGYQLIHVPGGANSADAKMIAVGSSIFRQYPHIKTIFIVSSDNLFIHLVNELLGKGLTVFWVKRKENKLIITKQNTGEIYYYSLELESKIPNSEDLLKQIENLLKSEYQLLEQKTKDLDFVTKLFQERVNLEQGKLENLNNQENTIISPPKTQNNSSIIKSSSDLEEILMSYILILKNKSKSPRITVTKLSLFFKQKHGYTLNEILKQLNSKLTITKFLQMSEKFVLIPQNKKETVFLVEIAENSHQLPSNIQEIKSHHQLNNILITMVKNLIQESNSNSVELTTLASEFMKQYGITLSAIIKQLNLGKKTLKFVQSYTTLKVDKIGTKYLVKLP